MLCFMRRLSWTCSLASLFLGPAATISHFSFELKQGKEDYKKILLSQKKNVLNKNIREGDIIRFSDID